MKPYKCHCGDPSAVGHFLCRKHLRLFAALTSADVMSRLSRCVSCGEPGTPNGRESLTDAGLCRKCVKDAPATGAPVVESRSTLTDEQRVRQRAGFDALSLRPSREDVEAAERASRPTRRAAYHGRQAAEAAARAEAKAQEVTAFVATAESYPVRKSTVVAALGSGTTTDKAIALAIERGDIVSPTRCAPALRGYYPKENQTL
jgi:hypothetical protein